MAQGSCDRLGGAALKRLETGGVGKKLLGPPQHPHALGSPGVRCSRPAGLRESLAPRQVTRLGLAAWRFSLPRALLVGPSFLG